MMVNRTGQNPPPVGLSARDREANQGRNTMLSDSEKYYEKKKIR